MGKWISAEQYQENQQLVNDLLTEDDPALGSDQPLVYIVAYQSFGCPFSKDNQADIKAMTDKFGPIISFVFKDFPTESLYENVFQAHLAASCAQEQGHFGSIMMLCLPIKVIIKSVIWNHMPEIWG